MQDHGNVLLPAGYAASLMRPPQPMAPMPPQEPPPYFAGPPGGGIPTYSGFNDYYPWLTGEDVVNGVGFFP